MNEQASHAAFRGIHEALAASPRTREPMNALVVWTELGRGLAGMLERVGADKGLLGEVVRRWCEEQGAAAGVDLARWVYRLAPEARLTREDLAQALRRATEALQCALPALAAEAEAGGEGRRSAFLAVVRGWFPVGLDLVRSLPAARTATEAERLGALGAWCDRYLPIGPAAANELGVRIDRDGV